MNDQPPPEILSGLNNDQYQAATHETGPLLILAGAGSGKTRTITHRIAWLVRERAVHPSSILAVTFTNKAAGEMRDRVRGLLEGGGTPAWMGTFHSVCLRLLRMNAATLGYPSDFVVYDDDDSERLMKLVLDDMSIPRDQVRRFTSFADRLKNDGFVDAPEPTSNYEAVAADAFRRYQRALVKSGAMDFGDLLVQALRLMDENPDVREHLQASFAHIIVDEFQDTNLAQYRFLKLLCRPRPNICVVGDDDQSIYSWRGARVANILEFADDFPDAVRIVLGQNYRSREPVLAAASRVIGFNRSRYPKSLSAVRGPGENVYVHRSLNEVGEASFVVAEMKSRHRRGIPYASMAAFYRTNAQSRVFEDALRRQQIPYRVVGGMRFYQRAEVKDIISYLRLLVNPLDSVSLERVVNVPARGIGKATMDKARERSAAAGIPMLEALAAVGDEAGKAIQGRIRGFVDMICDLAIFARDNDARTVVEKVIAVTGYRAALEAEGTEEAGGRAENVDELVNSVQEFMNQTGERKLAAFLDRVALVQPLDEARDGDAVNLMTVHAAKGLEFELVFVTGLEHGLFPLRSRRERLAIPGSDPLAERDAIDEERRLMYVAMTRARDVLYMSYSRTRMTRGFVESCRPSVFLSELPRNLVTII